MRALIVSPYFPPQQAVASLRIHSFARHWSEAGIDVTVLTTKKRGDQQTMPIEPGAFRVVEVSFRGPRVLERLRARSRTAPNVQRASNGTPGTLRELSRGVRRPLSVFMKSLQRLRATRGVYASVRMPDLTDYWVNPAVQWCAEQVAEHREQDHAFDVVLSSSGPYTAHLVAREIKRRGWADHWVADFRDLWTDHPLYRGLFPFTLRESRLERACLAEVDQIITATDGLAERLRGRTNVPVDVIYNGFDEGFPGGLPPESAWGDEKTEPDVRLVYTGTVYERRQSPGALVEALSELARIDPDLAGRVRLVVAGRDNTVWRTHARQLGVTERVEDLGHVSRARALRMQRDADLLIMLDWSDPKQGVLTAKLFEYLSQRAPILIIGDDPGSPIAEVVLGTGRGVLAGIDPVEIARAIVRIASPRAGESFAGDRSQIAQYSRAHQAARLLELIERHKNRASASVAVVRGEDGRCGRL